MDFNIDRNSRTLLMQEGAWTHKPTYCTRWGMLPDFRDREAAKSQCLTHYFSYREGRPPPWWLVLILVLVLVLVSSAPRADG